MLKKLLELTADAIYILIEVIYLNMIMLFLGWLLPKKQPKEFREDLQNLINKYIS